MRRPGRSDRGGHNARITPIQMQRPRPWRARVAEDLVWISAPPQARQLVIMKAFQLLQPSLAFRVRLTGTAAMIHADVAAARIYVLREPAIFQRMGGDPRFARNAVTPITFGGRAGSEITESSSTIRVFSASSAISDASAGGALCTALFAAATRPDEHEPSDKADACHCLSTHVLKSYVEHDGRYWYWQPGASPPGPLV
jgi:hypothetical protein